MGQAKNRGTFEERKARAISNQLLDNASLTSSPIIGKKKMRVSHAVMLAAAFGGGMLSGTKENK